MKQSLLLQLSLLLLHALCAQNVGIGTNSPAQKLDVNGAIRLGSTDTPVPGTIRYNPNNNDFEGYTGIAWVSLTGGKNAWGNRANYSYENGDVEVILNFNSDADRFGTGLGRTITTYGNYLIAGAPYDFSEHINGLTDAGTVRIIKRTGAAWNATETVKSPFPAMMEYFGSSVSMDGNYFVVGASGNNSYRGRIYFFRYDEGESPEYLTSLAPGDGVANDRFGNSVALSGDHVIVGSYTRKVGSNNQQGRASIYKRNAATNTWQHVQHLYAPDGKATDHFGEQVAMQGTIAAVTSRVYTGADTGAVHVYEFRNGSWVPDTVLIGRKKTERFGSSLFIKGDTLLVGAPCLPGSSADTGKVYIYVRSNNSWSLQAIIQPDDSPISNSFGSSVWLENGYLAVGAQHTSAGFKEWAGSAYVFRYLGGAWHRQAVLAPSDSQSDAHFGFQVALNGNTCFVSAPGEAVAGEGEHGRIYYYYR